MKMFLDKNKPLHTCDEKSCDHCDVKELVYCHFNMKLLFQFIIVAIPCFIIGGIGVSRFNPWLLIPWIVFFVLYFGLIEIRVMCSHCPHYAEPETKTLTCWANYGSPKLWKYRPGPMSLTEKFVFFSGLVIIIMYPSLIMTISEQFILLTVFVLYAMIAVFLMHLFMCRRCMNFACPLNSVPKDVKDKFMSHNSIVCHAWNQSEKQ
ncbi:MAG: hypothetical protein JXQ23_00735 [Clostridia bacterium]|nr:hypothetical protein [Clostridia bacterium]